MIQYIPCAGPTINEAFTKAINMAKSHNDLVHALINDIHMYITPNSNLHNTIRLYHLKKDMEYKIRMGMIVHYQR